MINIPNKDQWQKMNEHLAAIAGALGTQLDVSTWAGVQTAVRAGMGPLLFPIGTSFEVEHTTYGKLQFDVVAHDHFKGAYDDGAHTMTLMCHNYLSIKPQFDSPEALFYANSPLPEGRYKFKVEAKLSGWQAGEYEFELINTLPQDGKLCFSGNPATALTDLKVMVYDSDNTLIEECNIFASESSSQATPLSATGLNHLHRAAYGSDNYKESAIRQFLNSSAAAGSVWTPQTKFDQPPTWVNNTAGFLNGIDSEFLAVVGEVKVPCITNDSYEAPDSTTKVGETYVLKDKFYLASAKEVFDVGDKVPEDGSTVYAFFKGVSNADRIKYFSGSARAWGLRSPYASNAYSCCAVNTDGTFYFAVMSASLGAVPVCNIV